MCLAFLLSSPSFLAARVNACVGWGMWVVTFTSGASRCAVASVGPGCPRQGRAPSWWSSSVPVHGGGWVGRGVESPREAKSAAKTPAAHKGFGRGDWVAHTTPSPMIRQRNCTRRTITRGGGSRTSWEAALVRPKKKPEASGQFRNAQASVDPLRPSEGQPLRQRSRPPKPTLVCGGGLAGGGTCLHTTRKKTRPHEGPAFRPRHESPKELGVEWKERARHARLRGVGGLCFGLRLCWTRWTRWCLWRPHKRGYRSHHTRGHKAYVAFLDLLPPKFPKAKGSQHNKQEPKQKQGRLFCLVEAGAFEFPSSRSMRQMQGDW